MKKRQTKKALTWLEKLQTKKTPLVKKVESDFADIQAGSTMLVATPQIFEDYVYKIKRGDSKNLKQIRADLARLYSANSTCPVTTGIFLRIVAEANYERMSHGVAAEKVAPFWRAIAPGSSLARKLSFGEDMLIELRKAEGIKD